MKILVLDPVSSGSAYPRLLREQGLDCVTVDTQRALTAGLRAARTPNSQSFEEDFGADPARLAEWCHQQGVGHHIIGAESAVPLAEALTSHLETPTRNDANFPSRRWDKVEMIKALTSSGVDAPDSFWAADQSEMLTLSKQLFRDGHEQYVVKPSIGAGTVDVRAVRGQQEFLDLASKILSNHGLFGDSPRVLVQQFVRGREYVIDTFSIHGKHGIAAVCTYDKHPSSGGSFVYDRLRWLDPRDPEVAVLEAYAFRALDALGVESGVGHMEVILSDQGAKLIDFGARPHGAGHPMRTYDLTSSSQMHVEVAHAVALANGQAYTPPVYELLRQGSIEFFNIPSSATARQILNVDALRAIGGVRDVVFGVKAGRAYEETHDLLDGLSLGLAFLTARNADELRAIGRVLRQTFLENFIQSPSAGVESELAHP